MPQNPEEFAKELREWSRWKHAILSGYLARFSGILQRYDTAYYIDGFAGVGKYDDGSKGSALRAAEMAQNIAKDAKRKYNLHCINVEQDSNVFAQLVKATEPYRNYVTNYSGDFSKHVNSILGEIAEQPALFFLDPFGVKGLEWNNLLHVLKRNPTSSGRIKTELLIRYDAQAMSRLAGCIGNVDSASEKNVRRLLEIFGLDSESAWEEYIKPLESSKQFANETSLNGEFLTSAYKMRLNEYFDYVVDMPIRKTDTGQLKYYLLFATRSPKAISVMNDMLYEVDDIREKVSIVENPQNLLPGFEPQRDTLAELNKLKEIILNELPVNTPIRRDELITKVVAQSNYFGFFSGTHFTAVLGGRTRKITVPKNFDTLKSQVNLDGAASDDRTTITRTK